MPYSFKYDWFTGNIPVFQRFLTQFRDNPVRALEIGTHEGRSTTWLLDNILTNDDSRIVSIDIFKQENLEANLAATGARNKVELLISPSHQALSTIADSSFDFAYIDGSHWACDVLEDAVLAFRRVKPGGVIGFDDYLWNDPKYNEHGTPKPAIDAFLECFAHKVTVLEHGYQVWVRKTSD